MTCFLHFFIFFKYYLFIENFAFYLQEGATTIGTDEVNDSEDKPDIILNGLGLERRHCTIRLEEGVATLEPEVQAQCLVNSVLVDKPTRLSQGNYFFSFSIN